MLRNVRTNKRVMCEIVSGYSDDILFFWVHRQCAWRFKLSGVLGHVDC